MAQWYLTTCINYTLLPVTMENLTGSCAAKIKGEPKVSISLSNDYVKIQGKCTSYEIPLKNLEWPQPVGTGAAANATWKDNTWRIIHPRNEFSIELGMYKFSNHRIFSRVPYLKKHVKSK